MAKGWGAKRFNRLGAQDCVIESAIAARSCGGSEHSKPPEDFATDEQEVLKWYKERATRREETTDRILADEGITPFSIGESLRIT